MCTNKQTRFCSSLWCLARYVLVCVHVIICREKPEEDEPAPPSLQHEPNTTLTITPNKAAAAKPKAKPPQPKKKDVAPDPFRDSMLKAHTRSINIHENILEFSTLVPVIALRSASPRSLHCGAHVAMGVFTCYAFTMCLQASRTCAARASVGPGLGQHTQAHVY